MHNKVNLCIFIVMKLYYSIKDVLGEAVLCELFIVLIINNLVHGSFLILPRRNCELSPPVHKLQRDAQFRGLSYGKKESAEPGIEPGRKLFTVIGLVLFALSD